MRSIDQVPRPDLLKTMNVLIESRLFSGLETRVPEGVVSTSSVLPCLDIGISFLFSSKKTHTALLSGIGKKTETKKRSVCLFAAEQTRVWRLLFFVSVFFL
jgi:hypothetical protein